MKITKLFYISYSLCLVCVKKIMKKPIDSLLYFQNSKGFLGYTDVSMGTRVASICTGLGRLDTMTQSPSNAIIFMGHAPGKVILMLSPLVKM